MFSNDRVIFWRKHWRQKIMIFDVYGLYPEFTGIFFETIIFSKEVSE